MSHGNNTATKKKEDIIKLKQMLMVRGNLRDYTLVTMGLNTALRISDILDLCWKDVYDFEHKNFYTHFHVKEKKNGKSNYILLNEAIKEALELLLLEQHQIYPNKVIFLSRNGDNKSISRFRAYSILKEIGKDLGFGPNFSCHSLRKTFGYHAWKQGESPVLIMTIYNHSSFEITKKYLSIEQDDKDGIYARLQF